MKTGADIQQAVTEAARCVSAYHPLRGFIHCNALQGLEDMPFEAAMGLSRGLFAARAYLPLSEYKQLYRSGRITSTDLKEAFARAETVAGEAVGPSEIRERTLSELLDAAHRTEITSSVNRHMVKWCCAYFDETQAQWPMDGEGGLFKSWRRLVQFDASLSFHGARNWKQTLQSLPEEPDAALQSLLVALGVDATHVVAYLQSHLLQMPGWSSHLKWWQHHNDKDAHVLIAYLAIRLFYELQLCTPVAERYHPAAERTWEHQRISASGAETDQLSRGFDADRDYLPVWQDAYEINYRRALVNSLRQSASDAGKRRDKPDCQIVFCIDVRSEPIRRLLDKSALYETHGFAGFFGFPMKFNQLGSALTLDLCPVLVTPTKHVHEVSDDKVAKRLSSLQAIFAAALHLQKRLKSNLAGAFGLVETFGPWSAFPLIGRTFLPRTFHRACDHAEQRLAGVPHTHLDASAFSLQEKVAMSAANLKALGLDKKLAPVVVLCGHRSQSANNPFAAALDCGACGGNPGGVSAKFAAGILNDPEVRQGLQALGIVVPQETVFIAAEHNTTTDTFEFFHSCQLTDSHERIIDRLKKDLTIVGNAVRSQRARALPKSGLGGLNEPCQRAHDWAQLIPEWGLSGNACFIAAPADLTRGLDLGGRAFLQTYDCEKDAENTVLEQVMTAPLIVAQWINAEFYLSTVDNEVFGSGSKAVHNVVGDFGVMQGASGDLRIGLPWQSVMSAENVRHHEPMRLVAVIRASRDSIDRMLAKYDKLSDLVRNRWIRLVALDPSTGEFFEADDASGQWRVLPATATEDSPNDEIEALLMK